MIEHVKKAVEDRLARKRRDVLYLAGCAEQAEIDLKMYSSSLEAAKAEVAALETWLKETQ